MMQEKARVSFNLYEHILILNYNSKALELISDYQHDDLTTLVVVLSDQDKVLWKIKFQEN